MANDTLFGLDGTQDPPPPPLFPDPLAGLITGSMPAPEDGSLSPVVRVAQPAKPDEQAIRQAVEAAMAEERAGRSARAARPARPAPAARSAGPSGATGLLGARRGIRNPPRVFAPGGGTRLGSPPQAPGAALPAPGLARRGPGTERTTSTAGLVVKVVLATVVVVVLLLIVLGVVYGNSGSVGQ